MAEKKRKVGRPSTTVEERLASIPFDFNKIQLLAEDGLTDAVRFMLDHGTPVDQPDQWGITPLHAAALRGQTEVVRLLLDRGANANARTDKGQTPVMYALERGNERSVRGENVR